MSRTKLPIDGRTWQAIERLLSRPWFERMWIVQEMFCANKGAVVQCGRRVARWLVLYRATSALAAVQRPIPSDVAISAIVGITGLTEPQLESHNGVLSRVLSRARGRKCSDERDRVYGILALLSAAFRAVMGPPSYDVPANDVFINVTLAHIRHLLRLELLELCNVAHRIADDVPSWVPNLSTFGHGSDYYPQFAAGYSECFHATVATKANLLRVLGTRCAVVRRTAAVDIEREKLSEIAARLASEVGVGVESDALTTREPCFRELLAKTINYNLLAHRFSRNNVPSMDAWCAVLDTVSGEGHEDPDCTAWKNHKSFVADLISGDLLLITKEGLLGIGPEDSRQDDIIVVLLGCNSPMLLRPGPNPSEYLVVGPCYSVNLEDATALLGPLPLPVRVELFQDYHGGGVAMQFLDAETGLQTDEDPRLPPPWEAVDNVAATRRLERTLDDPWIFRRFRNRETGEVVNSDPRMSPDALRARGVALEYFTLA